MRPLVVPSLVAIVVSVLSAPAAGATTFAAPVEPAAIERGCDYGGRDCLDPRSYHAGVDYLPDELAEPILASADGMVRVAAEAGSDASHEFGNVVVLEHTLPGGGRVSTVYGHMRDRPMVEPGDCVRRRTRLGTMGSTGAATNVHLHFEVKSEPKLGPPYGYTAGDPDGYGFFDPKSFVGQREALGVCGPAPAPGAEPSPPPAAAPASDCTRGDPRAALARPLRAGRELRASGRVRRVAAGCRVQLALVRRAGGRCAFWRASRRRMEWRSCASPVWTGAGETLREGDLTRWSHRFRASVAAGSYELRLRLVDRRGRVHVPAGRAALGFSLGPPR